MSVDHKPNNPGEEKRIKKKGGRVEPYWDEQGKPLGPHRVWLKNENIPGLAMSRSLGDLVAASVGVSPEPEVLDFNLERDDKFIVIASDGVWEFLSNDRVMNLVKPYYLKNLPEKACNRLVKESVIHWKKEDEVIDDITCVCLFLN